MHSFIISLALALTFSSISRVVLAAPGAPQSEDPNANILPFQACVDENKDWLPDPGKRPAPTMEILADQCEEAHFQLAELLKDVQDEVSLKVSSIRSTSWQRLVPLLCGRNK